MNKFLFVLFVFFSGCKIGGNIVIKNPHEQRPDITIAITVDEAYETYNKRN